MRCEILLLWLFFDTEHSVRDARFANRMYIHTECIYIQNVCMANRQGAKSYPKSALCALTAGDGYDELTEECQTKGGLNEQALNDLNKSGAFDHWTEALEGIRTRLA